MTAQSEPIITALVVLEFLSSKGNYRMERIHMTLRQPYLCSKTKKRGHIGVPSRPTSHPFLAEVPRAPSAPAGGASIAMKYGEPIEPRKFGYEVMSVRTYVRPYARIRPGDEFAFVLDLESFLRKK